MKVDDFVRIATELKEEFPDTTGRRWHGYYRLHNIIHPKVKEYLNAQQARGDEAPH